MILLVNTIVSSIIRLLKQKFTFYLLISLLTTHFPFITKAQQGLNFNYYEGNFSSLPDFSKINPEKNGQVSNFLINDKNREDQFAFSFEGFFAAEKNGNYVFSLNSDDGSRLFINDKLIINNQSANPRRRVTGSVRLSKGQHAVRVEYFDKSGRHMLRVMVQPPGERPRKIRNNELYLRSENADDAPSGTAAPQPEETVSSSIKVYKNRVFDGGPLFVLREADSGTQFINCTFKNYKQGTAIRIEGATNVLIKNSKFININGNQKGKDAHAIECNRVGINVIVEDSYFKNIGADGIHLGHSGTDIRNWLIKNNEFVDCGENGLDIKTVHGNIIVQNNHFEGSKGCPKGSRIGCTGDNGTGLVVHRYARGVEINGNVFTDNVYGLRVAKGVKNEPPYDIKVLNNFFYNNSKYGLHVFEAALTYVYNNTFYNNQQANFQIKLRSGQKLFNRNNLFVGRGGKSMEHDGKGNLYFASADAAGLLLDQHNPVLKSGSPAINRGVEIPIVSRDFYRNTRPVDGAFDTGAIEFTNGANGRYTLEKTGKAEVEESLPSLSTLSMEGSVKTTVFPNPASNQLNVQFENPGQLQDLDITITDISGKTLIHEKHILDPHSLRLSIPLTQFQDGLYFLTMTGGAFKNSSKFIVKK
jgi:hypothetical protein